MKASNHPAYEAAVRAYAGQVAGPDAPMTPQNSFALGCLQGTCTTLGLDMLGEAVRADIEDMRKVIWPIRVRGNRKLKTPISRWNA